MSFYLTSIGLEKLLRGEQVDIVGVRETLKLSLDDSALGKAKARRLYEIFSATNTQL